MAKLTTEQLIYLLYARAYTEKDTVIKSTVKSYLAKEWKVRSEQIYDALQTQELIKQASKGRFYVTEQGLQALVTNLATTDYGCFKYCVKALHDPLFQLFWMRAMSHTSSTFDEMAIWRIP